jgi:cell division protein FtsB
MFDFDEIFSSRTNRRVILVVLLAMMVGFYIYNLMFGDRSFSQMIELENSLTKLTQNVERLRKENEKLQKEYFELKELESE